ncbi:hypothetical protein [Longirhabdus pacifica]|uniref:hypothetical protein n=1 Tax=Longirhabdus pacifica TaxID=2305227 RepID=UPI0010091806|nr:hypothetical protein [Longirhabdus pacifica]
MFKKYVVFLLSLLLMAASLLPTSFSEVEAASYDWNIYSSSIEFKATGQDFYNKSCGQVNNATQGYFRLPTTYANQTIESYSVGAGKYVELNFGGCSTYGMTHILSRHVPEYFIGNVTRIQSFFNPGYSIGYYENLVEQIVYENAYQILQYGFTSSGTAVYGNAYGNPAYPVKLIIKGGKVITMYSSGWGIGEDLR